MKGSHSVESLLFRDIFSKRQQAILTLYYGLLTHTLCAIGFLSVAVLEIITVHRSL